MLTGLEMERPYESRALDGKRLDSEKDLFTVHLLKNTKSEGYVVQVCYTRSFVAHMSTRRVTVSTLGAGSRRENA
jgi:hypothetical protein